MTAYRCQFLVGHTTHAWGDEYKTCGQPLVWLKPGDDVAQNRPCCPVHGPRNVAARFETHRGVLSRRAVCGLAERP